MQKVVFVFLFSCFSLNIVSCSEKDDFDITRWEKYGAIQLSAPANLTATGADSKVTLDWTVLSGATSYNVYWDNATGVSSSSTTITGISTDNYTHSSLNNGTTYYYKVAAVDSNGATGFLSSEVNSTPTKDYALDFDGTNDYVAADGVTSNLDSSTGLPFTVSAWAYPDTTVSGTTACCSKREAIFAFNKTGNSDENLNMLYFAQDGSTQKFYHHGTGNNNYTGTSNTFESGQWYHIALIVDSSGNGKLYINGGQEATWSNGSNTSVNKFSIGQEYDGTGSTATDFFDGKIDEVAIWNVALSAADVTALYNSGDGLKASADSGNYDNSSDLIGYWKFNEGTGSTLTDSTSNLNNGTLTNMDSSDWVTSGLNLIDW